MTRSTLIMRIFAALSLVFMACAGALTANAQDGAPNNVQDSVQDTVKRKAEIYTSWRNNLAVGGYDAVSFFSATLQKGHNDIIYNYKGVEWRFASKDNRDAFVADPNKYAPQYGGYCAWAIAQNKLAKGSPRHWHIDDEGRLFLNFNARINRRLLSDKATFIMAADDIWPDILLDKK